MDSERSVGGTKIKSRFLEIPKKQQGSIEAVIKVAEEEELDHGQELLRMKFPSIWPLFLEMFIKLRKAQ